MDGIKAKCDFCKNPAIYDAKTVFGPWGYLCETCFETRAIGIPGTFTRIANSILETKKCYHCGQDKPVSEFYGYTDSNGNHRFRSECKACNLERRRKQRMNKK